MVRYSYTLIPSLSIPKSTYELGNDFFICPLFNKDRTEFFQCGLGKSIAYAIAFSKEENPDLNTDHIEDFVLFHCFITQDPFPYEWFEKINTPIYSKESKSREAYIVSIQKDQIIFIPSGIFPPEDERDFDYIAPFIFDRKYRISYAKTFNKFLQAKKEDKRIYNYIRLYDFATNLSQVNRLYDNIALSLSLLYTILDSFLNNPRQCSRILTCESCGRTNIPHGVESLSAYQNRKITDLLGSKEQSIIQNYQRLLQEMNKIRSETYHGAIFHSLFDEWLQEAKTTPHGRGAAIPKLPIKQMVEEFKTSYLAKSYTEWLFSDLIRSLLIGELTEDMYLPSLLMDLGS